jgi:hypothetical protein
MFRIIFLLILLIAGFSVRSQAKHKLQGKQHGGHEELVDRFFPGDREIVGDYFHAAHSGLPPGLAKRGGSLPPGLEKHLRKTGELPPGLQKKLAPFPPELEDRLPPLRAGLRRGMIGHIAIVWNPRTAIIIDWMNLD